MSLKVALLAFLLASISRQTNERQVEDDLYQCLDQHYTAHNIDLASSLDSLEDYLIAEDLLKTKDGQGKIDFYKQVVESGEFPRVRETDLLKTLRESYINSESLISCLKTDPDFDSLMYYSSPFHINSKKIANEVSEQGAISPVIVSRAIVNNLAPTDFDHPFYRAHMLLSFVSVNEGEKAFIRTIKREDLNTSDSSSGFTIDFSMHGILYANGQPIEKEKLASILIEYLQEPDPSKHIRLKVDKTTLYGQFREIYDSIQNAYHTRWNQASLEEFQEPFEQLDQDKKESIKSMFPFRIIEVVDR